MKKITLVTAMFMIGLLSAYAQGVWTQENLSDTRVQMGVATHGSKIYFAGGLMGSNETTTNLVEIFDVESQEWDTTHLSVARSFPAGISFDNKIFFAGGIDVNTGQAFSVVDIYDTQSKTWTTTNLSEPRFGVATVAYGDEILFAGGINVLLGINYKVVDKYNTLTGMWTTDTLSENRSNMGYALLGTKAFFAGGFAFSSKTVTNKIDIYDFNTGVWTTNILSLARGFVDAVAIDNKIIFAGGMTASNTPTDKVDIYDSNTDTWKISNLSTPRGFLSYSASACDRAYFVGGGNFNFNTTAWTSASNVIDIYNPEENGSWSVEHIPNRALINHSVAAVDSQLFVAGGTGNNTPYKTVDIYTCFTTGTENIQSEPNIFSVYPNPAKEVLIISYPLLAGSDFAINITDITGKIVYTTPASPTGKTEVNTGNFTEGVYLVQIRVSGIIESQKVIVIK